MDKFVKAHDHSRIGYYIRPSGCWEWTGADGSRGYGQIWPPGIPKAKQAHRWIYQKMGGVIPEGKQCHHTCANKKCVNPAHIEIVTAKEHFDRDINMRKRADINRAKTHCPYGHEYTVENTYIGKKNIRYCKTCNRVQKRQYRAQHKITGAIRFDR